MFIGLKLLPARATGCGRSGAGCFSPASRRTPARWSAQPARLASSPMSLTGCCSHNSVSASTTSRSSPPTNTPPPSTGSAGDGEPLRRHHQPLGHRLFLSPVRLPPGLRQPDQRNESRDLHYWLRGGHQRQRPRPADGGFGRPQLSPDLKAHRRPAHGV